MTSRFTKSNMMATACKCTSTREGRRSTPVTGGLDQTVFTHCWRYRHFRRARRIDGEVVVVHEARTNFSELQAELAAGAQDRLIFYAFDLLWRDGDHRKLPQIERKQLLADLLGENNIDMPVLYSEHLTGDGRKMFARAAKLNWEGIISKEADAPVSI